jgi:hypothetical protein
MKKMSALVVLLVAIVLVAMGCSSESPLAKAGFEEGPDGAHSYLSKDSSPLGEGGIKVNVTTGSAGEVVFIVTDATGAETKDSYTFKPADNTLLRHRYVAAMGQEYNYHFDCAAMELTSVSDGTGKDVTEPLKSMGRWDSQAAEIKEQAEKLISYFNTTFGMSMGDAVAQD